MPELQIYKHSAFPSDLNWQAVSFLRMEWPWIEGGFPRQTQAAEMTPTHFALVKEGFLLSYAAVVSTQLTHGGVVYATCGLGSVFTYPACRGKGYGKLIVDAATRFMSQTSADIGLLFCQPKLQEFYSRSGWQALMETPLFLDTSCTPSDSLIMMLFFSKKGQTGRAAFETEPVYVPVGW